MRGSLCLGLSAEGISLRGLWESGSSASSLVTAGCWHLVGEPQGASYPAVSGAVLLPSEGLFHSICELCSQDEMLSWDLERIFFYDPHELSGRSSW